MAPPRSIEANRTQMRNIARAMRADLDTLKSGSVRPLDAGPKTAGTVGKWDVAGQLGTGVDQAHRNMVAALESFIREYEEVIAGVDRSVAGYDRAEAATASEINRQKLRWALNMPD